MAKRSESEGERGTRRNGGGGQPSAGEQRYAARDTARSIERGGSLLGFSGGSGEKSRSPAIRETLGHVFRWLLIVCLLGTAAWLLLRTGFFSLGDRYGAQEKQEPAVFGIEVQAEALPPLYPETVAVILPSGERLASAREGETTRQAFLGFFALLGEALGSSGPPEAVTEGRFRGGMENGCAFFDLGLACPMDVLCSWVGADEDRWADYRADKLFLGLEQDEVSLCFRDSGGAFYHCVTAVQPETLSLRMADFSGEPARFAYENGLLRGVEPYMVISGGTSRMSAVSVSSGREAVDTALLAEALGMNSRLISSYYDADNTLVMNEDERILRLDRDGNGYFRFTGLREGAPEEEFSLSQAVQIASVFALRAAAACGGDARLSFAAAEPGEIAGEYVVGFDFCLDGIPVLQPEGRAVEVTVRDAVVRQVQLLLRCYWLDAGTDAAVLPPLQAAAASAGRGGGTPILVYLDTGGAVQRAWVDRRGVG